MNIYLIERDAFDFLICEYNAHVIVANDEVEVRKVAKRTDSNKETDWDKAKITLQGIYTGERKNPFIILSDFDNGLTGI
jgi:hypothetical protein